MGIQIIDNGVFQVAWRPNLIYIVLCGLLGGTNALYMGFCGWSGDHVTVSYSMWAMRGKIILDLTLWVAWTMKLPYMGFFGRLVGC